MESTSFDRTLAIEGSHAFKVGFIIALVGAIVLLPFTLMSFFTMFSFGISRDFHPEELSALVTFISLIGAVVSLIALYFIYEGFSKFSHAMGGFSLGKSGTIFYIIMTIISPVYPLVAIGTILSGIASLQSAFFVLAFSAIFTVLLFLARLLIAIDLFRIGDESNKILITLGAIFYIFIVLVGVILLLIGFHQLEEDLRAGKPFGRGFRSLPPLPPPPV